MFSLLKIWTVITIPIVYKFLIDRLRVYFDLLSDFRDSTGTCNIVYFPCNLNNCMCECESRKQTIRESGLF